MAVLAPMPNASVTIATAVKPGLLRSWRSAKRRSPRSVCIARPPGSDRGHRRLAPALLDDAAVEEVDRAVGVRGVARSEEHTSELQSHVNLVCRLLLEKKKKKRKNKTNCANKR